MKTKDVYQADQHGFFLYAAVANELTLSPDTFNIPYGALEKAPPEPGEGMVAKWDGAQWTVVEDHRSDKLYLVRDGSDYQIGGVVKIGDESVTYDGGGPVPSWLTLDTPVRPDPKSGEI